MDRLQRELNRLFEPLAGVVRAGGNFPAVNIWTGEDEALLTAELPGIDPAKIEVSVKNDTVTVRGSRELEELRSGESYVRQERGAGTFVRSFALPFPVDSEKVTAQYRVGILQLRLPRSESDKPRKITVKAG
ncbi:MAG: Hsp20/alpha crystallin family protein [Lentisphaeria bacterium]|nr:Hsp20/alpha crystallin family protein [Lentisphaeria bacterium]